MNIDYLKRMFECTTSNVDLYTALHGVCQQMISDRGGRSKVTLNQAEEIDVEVTLLLDELMNNEWNE